LEISPFENSWEICRNSFKPYAACQLTHAAIDAAHLSITRLAGRPIKRIKAIVNPLATQIAGLVNASTPREGKFSTAFCIALALKGHPVTTDDFNLDRLQDLELRELASRVELEANNSISRTSAHLAIELVDGEVFTQEVDDALGSISNPLGWTELDQKFLSLVKPMIQEKATDLLDILHGFDESGSLVRMFELTVNKRYFP
jgi:2-methylcitrate dehydratase PrpD